MSSSLGVLANEWGLQYSIHECPKRFEQEMQHIFPQIETKGLYIIPTCQRSVVDLAAWGEEADQQKDLLLEKFVVWARDVCEVLSGEGHWCDYVDPCSGLSMIHRQTMNVYSEVESLQQLLGYKTSNAGGCRIILHPEWGAAVYPATLFAKAPLQSIQNAIQQANTKFGQGRFMQ